MKAALTALLGLAVTTSVLIAPAAATPPPPTQAAIANIRTTDGKDVGVAYFREGPRGVIIRLAVRGLKPGWHGLHFHEKGDCSAPDFKSAGSHMHDIATGVHGLMNIQGNDNGDLPNLYVAADGTAVVELLSPFVSINGSETYDGVRRPALFDQDGSALIIHENADDYMSQPAGNAGARIACGVIQWGPIPPLAA